MEHPLRIGIVDSGVHPGHPHVPGSSIAAGALIGRYQNRPGEYLDQLGHGTAVAGAVLSHAPDARLYIAKVFEKTLNTRVEIILHALRWCVEEHGVDLVNLSLGAHHPGYAEALVPWASRTTLICPTGGFPEAISVTEDATLPRDSWIRLGERSFAASGYPRPIPGRDERDNLSGVSFAVANFTGLAARFFSTEGRFPWDAEPVTPR